MDESGELASEEEAPVTAEAEPVVPLPPLVVHPALRRAYCDAIQDVLAKVKAREKGELGRDDEAADVIVARLKQVWLRKLKEEHRIDLLSELGDDLEDGARSQNGSMNSSPSVENGKRKRAIHSSPSVRNGKKKRQGGKKATADGPSSKTDSRDRKRRRKHDHLNLPKLGAFKRWTAGGSSGARRPLPAPLPLQPLPPPPPPSAILTGSGPLEANGGGPPTLLPSSLPDSFSTLTTTASQFRPLLSPVGAPFSGPPPFPPPALPPPPPVPLAPPPINANDILFGDDSDDDVQAPPPSAGLPLPPLVTPRPQEHMPSLDDLLMSDDISDHEGADNDGAGDGAEAAAGAAAAGGGGGGAEDEQGDEDEVSNGSGGSVRLSKANRMRRLLSGVGAVDVGDVEIEEDTLQEEAIRAALAAQADEGEEGDEPALKQEPVKMQSWAEFSQTLPVLQMAGDEEEEKEEEEQEKEEDGSGDGKRRKKLRKRRGVQFTKPDIDAATLLAEVDGIVLTDEEVFLPPERADRPSIMGKLVKFKRTDSWWRFTLEDCIYTSPTETFFLTELKCILTSWLAKG